MTDLNPLHYTYSDDESDIPDSPRTLSMKRKELEEKIEQAGIIEHGKSIRAKEEQEAIRQMKMCAHMRLHHKFPKVTEHARQACKGFDKMETHHLYMLNWFKNHKSGLVFTTHSKADVQQFEGLLNTYNGLILELVDHYSEILSQVRGDSESVDFKEEMDSALTELNQSRKRARTSDSFSSVTSSLVPVSRALVKVKRSTTRRQM